MQEHNFKVGSIIVALLTKDTIDNEIGIVQEISGIEVTVCWVAKLGDKHFSPYRDLYVHHYDEETFIEYSEYIRRKNTGQVRETCL